MKKGGQITVFFIIAILLIISTGIVLVVTNKVSIPSIGSSRHLSPEFEEIESTMKSCVKQRAIDAIRLVGIQGGYTTLTRDYLETNLTNVAYGYYEGKNTLPRLEVIEKEISNYVKDTIPYCLNPEDFSEYNITLSKSSAETKIKDGLVDVTGLISISIKKQERSLIADRKYSSEIPINLKEIIKIAEKTINKIIEDPEYIPVGYLAETDFFIIVLPIDEKRYIIGITQNKTETNIEGVPYTFLFAVKKK